MFKRDRERASEGGRAGGGREHVREVDVRERERARACVLEACASASACDVRGFYIAKVHVQWWWSRAIKLLNTERQRQGPLVLGLGAKRALSCSNEPCKEP